MIKIRMKNWRQAGPAQIQVAFVIVIDSLLMDTEKSLVVSKHKYI